MSETEPHVDTKKLKILQVIPYFNPKFGGDLNVCYNLSKQLAFQGHDVTIITTDYQLAPDFVQAIEQHGVSVLPFPTVLHLGLFLYTPSINAWLKDNVAQFDIIHMHAYRSYQNSCIFRHAKQNKIPYLVQPHGSLLPPVDKRQLKKLFDYVWGQKILENASTVLVLTATEKEYCQSKHIPENRIQILPNGINLKEFENLPAKGGFREKYGIPWDCQIVLYIGRLHKSKGLDILIDAFCELNIPDRDLQLIIIGPDDGYLQHLIQVIEQRNLEDSIRLIGFISPEEKIQAFIDADVFVTPSYSGFPITFLEACACGTPIITTNNGDRLDWINDAVGFVTEYDEQQLAEKIALILDDSELRRRYSDEGNRSVKQNFSLEIITSKYEKICRKVIG